MQKLHLNPDPDFKTHNTFWEVFERERLIILNNPIKKILKMDFSLNT